MSQTKLVRDNIPEVMQSKGGVPVVTIASEKIYQQKLFEKLQEECNEFLSSEQVEELADILEVIYAICDVKHISKRELEQLREEKAEKRGKFTKKLLLNIHE